MRTPDAYEDEDGGFFCQFVCLIICWGCLIFLLHDYLGLIS